MKIVVDADDAALDLKKIIIDHLRKKGIEVVDLDYLSSHPDANYADVGYNLALKIQAKEFDRGVLMCGTGQGVAMIANKVEGVYAGPCHDVYSAERIRKSNDAQILTLGSRVTGYELAKSIVDAWLKSEFTGGGSRRKVERMRELEKQSYYSCNRTKS